VKFHQQIS